MAASDVLRAHKTFNSGGAVTGLFVTVDITGLGIVSGDQLAVAIHLREASTTLTGWEAPAGWTLRQHPTQASGSFYLYTAKYGVDVTGTSWTWDNGVGNTTSTRWVAGLIALKGANATALQTTNGAAVATGTTSWASGSITTTSPTIQVGFVGARNNTPGTSWTWPGGWTVEDQDLTQAGSTNAITFAQAVNDTTPLTAGTYSVTPTGSSTAGTGAAGILAYTYATAANSGTAQSAYTATATAVGSGRWAEGFEGGSESAAITSANTILSSVDPGWQFTGAFGSAAGAQAAIVGVAESELSMLRRTRTSASVYYYRFYMYMPSYPLTANGVVFVKSGSTVIQALRLTATGQLQLRDGSTTRWTSTALPRNEWFRVEARVDTTAGTTQARLFTTTNLHGATADQDSGSQTLTGTGGATGITWGVDNGGSGPYTLLFDALSDDTVTWIGPVASGIPQRQAAWAAFVEQVSPRGAFSPPTTSTLLARSSVIAPTGTFTTKFVASSIPANTTYDMRGGIFNGYFYADAIFGFGTFSNGAGGTNATAHQLNNVPFELGGNSTPCQGLAVVGGKVTGDQDPGLTWEQMKHGSPTQAALDAGQDPATVYATVIVNNQNQDGDPRIHVANGSFAVVDGLRVYNTHDGLGLQGAASSITTDTGTVYVRNSWVYRNHDDAIENDLSYLRLNVDDCLFEECYSFISTRANTTLGVPSADKTQSVSNSIISLMPRPGPHKSPSSVSVHGHMYKSQGNSPGFNVSNTIFAVSAPATSTAGLLPDRPGLDSYTNVTIVWLGTGPYPGNVPLGCRVTTDPAVLASAVSLWKQRHGVTDFDNVDTTRLLAPLAVQTKLRIGWNDLSLRLGGLPVSAVMLGATRVL